MKDIAPELLEKLQEEFKNKFDTNRKIKSLYAKIKDKTATYEEANEFASEVGDILSRVFQENLSADILPDGRMYYNIADKIINPTMKENHDLVSAYAQDAQYLMNKREGMNIKAQKAEINQDRINGIIHRVSKEEDFDKIKWILDEPVKNFTQAVVDDTVKANTEFQYKAGLRPRIIRKEVGNCCDWCREVVGVYEYPDVPKDVFRRHRHCRCTVEYDPGDGRRQNVHTKKWRDVGKDDKIEERKNYNLEFNYKKKAKNLKILNNFKLEIDKGKQKNHIINTNEFKQRIKNGIEPSYFDNRLEEIRKYGKELIGTGEIIADKNDPNLLKEKTKNHDKLNAYVVNNINGKKVKTDRVVIRYNKEKGWHMYPDYPKNKKKGTKKK